MKRKIFLLIFIAITLALCLTACNGVNFDDLTISAESVSDIPAGVYTMDYTIDDLDKYSENFDLEVSVKIFDDSNNLVTVENNRTFTVIPDNVYYVTVYVKTKLEGTYQTKSKSYTITSIKTNPIITLKLLILQTEYDFQTITVNYGDNFDINSLPSIPDSYPVMTGYTYTIIDKYWIVNDEELLTQGNLNNITKSFTVYANFEYNTVPSQCTITFNSNGGTDTSNITQSYNSSITRPADPTKENSYFCGWYSDSALTTVYPWSISTTMGSSITLYAKWIETNGSTIDDSYLDFSPTAETGTGNIYYTISVKGGAILSGNIVLPNGYNNAPVTVIGDYAFSGQNLITEIIIPNTISSIKTGAFKNCTSLNHIDFNGCNIDRLNISMFENCTSLTEITVPDSVTNIVETALLGCLNLSTITFNSTSKLNTLSYKAFEATAITSIKLPKIMNGKITNIMKNKNGTDITITYYE